MLLSGNSKAVQINKRGIKENLYAFDMRNNCTDRNHWALCKRFRGLVQVESSIYPEESCIITNRNLCGTADEKYQILLSIRPQAVPVTILLHRICKSL